MPYQSVHLSCGWLWSLHVQIVFWCIVPLHIGNVIMGKYGMVELFKAARKRLLSEMGWTWFLVSNDWSVLPNCEIYPPLVMTNIAMEISSSISTGPSSRANCLSPFDQLPSRRRSIFQQVPSAVDLSRRSMDKRIVSPAAVDARMEESPELPKQRIRVGHPLTLW